MWLANHLRESAYRSAQLAGSGCATYRAGTTDADGAFAVTVPVAGEYRLHFEFWSIRVCRFYFGTNGLTNDQRQRSTATDTSA